MAGSAEELERQIDRLRTAVRQAVLAGDRVRARALRADLRRAEQEWERVLDDLAESAPDHPAADDHEVVDRHAERVREQAHDQPERRGAPEEPGSLLSIREQVHHALTLLSVPAAPKLICAVHEAFSAGTIVGARLTSLRRDEERSFRAAPYARPYYLCAALTADLLSPVRGLLAVSTWPMERRVVGPLSPRVHFLTAAIRVAEHIERLPEPGRAAQRLLWRFAANIPGAADGPGAVEPDAVAAAARAELEVHAEADEAQRREAAERARRQLDDVQQLYGSRLRVIREAS